MNPGKLATHTAELPVWFERIINENEFDFAVAVFSLDSKESTEAILKTLMKNLQQQ